MEEKENLVKKATKRRRFNFEEFLFHLSEYKKEFGNLNTPVSFVCKDGYKLGQKIRSIRCGTIKLSEQQTAKLNEIGFIWDALTFDFNKFYQHLLDYKKEFGNLNTPTAYACKDAYKLGQRISTIRSGIVKLSEQQKAKLNEIGFVWDARTFDFDKFYQHLLDYKKEFGNLNTPASYACNDGYKLGQKTISVRSGNTKLSEQQKAKLNEIGFIWHARNFTKLKNFKFEMFYNKLVEYKKQFGDCFVEFDCIVDNYELGFYLRNIRNYRIKLTVDQIEKLNNLGFVFDTQEYYKNKHDEPLIKRLLNGDISAKIKFIQEFMPYVYGIASRYKAFANFSDLVGIGYDGLIYALDQTTAIHDEQYLKKYVSKTIKWKIIKYIKSIKKVKSLSDEIADNVDLMLKDVVGDEKYRPDKKVDDEIFDEQLLSKTKQILTNDEYKLMCLYFGFNQNATEFTINQLAEKYNTTTKTIEKEIQKIIAKLKQNMPKEEWLF